MIRQDLDHDISERLRELEASISEPAWDTMERRLLGAFADGHESGASHPAADPRNWGLSAAWRFAAAAVVVLTAAITFYARPEPRRLPPPNPTDTTLSDAKTHTAPEPAGARSTPGARQKSAPVPARSSKPGSRVLKVATDPLDTLLPLSDAAGAFSDFVLLPGASSLPDFESGRIMRIELPLTGLPAYGLDMVLDAAPGTIEADLLVGQDGVPRAIRLASTESR